MITTITIRIATTTIMTINTKARIFTTSPLQTFHLAIGLFILTGINRSCGGGVVMVVSCGELWVSLLSKGLFGRNGSGHRSVAKWFDL